MVCWWQTHCNFFWKYIFISSLLLNKLSTPRILGWSFHSILQTLQLPFTFSISLCLCSIFSILVDSFRYIFPSLIFAVAVSNLLFNLSIELSHSILFLEVRFGPFLSLAHSFFKCHSSKFTSIYLYCAGGSRSIRRPKEEGVWLMFRSKRSGREETRLSLLAGGIVIIENPKESEYTLLESVSKLRNTTNYIVH